MQENGIRTLCRSDRIREANKQAAADARGYISRFADDSMIPTYTGMRRWIYRRRYGAWELKQAVQLSREHGIRRASEMTGVPYGTIHSTRYRSAIPKAGKNCLKNCLKALQLARTLHRSKLRTSKGELMAPIQCLFAALSKLGMSVASAMVFLTYESFPALPGFVIYADPTVQAWAEKIAAGRVVGSRLYVPPKAKEK